MTMTATARNAATSFDPRELEAKVKTMYKSVAENPLGAFHFEMGRGLAERLGYPAADLDFIPPGAIESFAGVGYYFNLAALRPGETVVDLGSGSGMDSFLAALKVARDGKVHGIDMTDEQLAKSRRLQAAGSWPQVEFIKGYIEDVPLGSGIADAVISNGVINLAPDKGKVFREAARLLKRGGRIALSDIVTDISLPQTIVCNSTLWAACIGGAAQRDNYRSAIEDAGLEVTEIAENPRYQFISDNAKGASRKYGVKSVSLLAVKR